MNNIELEILTFKPIHEKNDGKAILENLLKFAPDLTPDTFGNYEPIKQKFNENNLDTVLNNWQYPFLWKKKKPKSEGNISISAPSFKEKNNSIYLTIMSSGFDFQQVLNLFIKWCNLLTPYYSCITYLTENEINHGENASVVMPLDKKKTKFAFTLTIHQLKKYIPDLYWLTVFGENYINFFGRDKLLSCPVYKVTELDNGCIILQLSENIQDLDTNVDLIEDIRKKTKEHLNKNAFFEDLKGIDGNYETPWSKF